MPRPPWSETPILDWDDVNLEHIAQHAVAQTEVDEIFELSAYEVRPHKKRRKEAKYQRRYLVTGQTMGGRNLVIVIDKIDDGHIRPVTAFGR